MPGEVSLLLMWGAPVVAMAAATYATVRFLKGSRGYIPFYNRRYKRKLFPKLIKKLDFENTYGIKYSRKRSKNISSYGRSRGRKFLDTITFRNVGRIRKRRNRKFLSKMLNYCDKKDIFYEPINEYADYAPRSSAGMGKVHNNEYAYNKKHNRQNYNSFEDKEILKEDPNKGFNDSYINTPFGENVNVYTSQYKGEAAISTKDKNSSNFFKNICKDSRYSNDIGSKFNKLTLSYTNGNKPESLIMQDPVKFCMVSAQMMKDVANSTSADLFPLTAVSEIENGENIKQEVSKARLLKMSEEYNQKAVEFLSKTYNNEEQPINEPK
jgi:hypothetical protein